MVEQMEIETGRGKLVLIIKKPSKIKHFETSVSRLVKNKITWIVILCIIIAFTVGYFLGKSRDTPPQYYYPPPPPQMLPPQFP